MVNQKSIQITNLKGKLKLVSGLFMPSALGIVIYFVIFCITVAISQPSQYKTNLQTLNVNQLQGTFVYRPLHYVFNLANTQLANEIVIYAFWAIVATVIYLLASRLTKNVNELTQDIELREYIWPTGNDKNGPLRIFVEKLVFRLIMAILILVYIFKVLPALAGVWRTSDFRLRLTAHSIERLVVLFIVEALFLHLATVLIRLFLLRSRIIND